MVGPKKQDFLPKINILKGNHFIYWIQNMSVHQKLGMILENKEVQKSKSEQIVCQKVILKSTDLYYSLFNFEN